MNPKGELTGKAETSTGKMWEIEGHVDWSGEEKADNFKICFKFSDPARNEEFSGHITRDFS